MDDLELRFPLAFKSEIQGAAKRVQLPQEWVFAVARQESAFIPDARSSAGAVGLLQLLPGTAREVARKSRTPFNPAQLVEPKHSARLGSEYLRGLMTRYGDNRVLATAAYNAGPGRISRWLRDQPDSVTTDVWVETLPYRETREYVQSVLAFSVIYSYRLGSSRPLLGTNEQLIGNPASETLVSKEPAGPRP
jgi:soluble lytic murein transglycosylase